jgi:hypothetical protein
LAHTNTDPPPSPTGPFVAPPTPSLVGVDWSWQKEALVDLFIARPQLPPSAEEEERVALEKAENEERILVAFDAMREPDC